MNNIKVHFSSQRLDWRTPKGTFNKLNEEFHFDLDPCATKENALCKRYYTKEDDGLLCAWGFSGEDSHVFVNPPYGREISKWMKKAYTEIRQEYAPKVIVCLIPSRTDTKWWHNYVMKANEIRFIKGRLRFGDATNSAPFPSCIVIFKRK